MSTNGEGKPEMFLEVCDTREANEVDLSIYRIERFSDTKNSWIFVRRKAKAPMPDDKVANLLEVDRIDLANTVDMATYRFECFSETRGTWMFVKRRVV